MFTFNSPESVNITLHGDRNFADVFKKNHDEMGRLSCYAGKFNVITGPYEDQRIRIEEETMQQWQWREERQCEVGS